MSSDGCPVLQAFQRDLHSVKSVLGEPQEVTVATIPGAENLVDWMNCFRVTQVTDLALLPCDRKTISTLPHTTSDLQGLLRAYCRRDQIKAGVTQGHLCT